MNRQFRHVGKPVSEHSAQIRSRPITPHGTITAATAGLLVLMLTIGASLPAAAVEKKPYDKQLFRLTELLGAMHYLRELCGSNEGQLWRTRMRDIMKAEGSSTRRKLDLTRKFNFGYRSYSRTYHKCTPSARIAISRFINEAAVISDTMVRTIR